MNYMQKQIADLMRAVSLHKRVLLGIAFLVVLFSFAPSSFAQAGIASAIVNGILDALLFIPEKILGVVALGLQTLFGLIAHLMVIVIGWILGIGVRPGAETTPDFVSAGWNAVRNLVNMFFILVIAFIGLATILRLQSYELKKALPLLIVMALLVNFSGVFVGFIVDISNLIAQSFLTASANAAWGGLMDKVKALADVPMGELFTENDTPTSQKLVSHVVSIIFFLVAILIYFILMLVMVVRTMFLWVLVMLAPLAFVSYILPATRAKIWNEWWQQLLQWSIFIIPISFFLWLASLSLGFSFKKVSGGGDVSWLADILAPFTTLLILYIGVTISQQMAPAAARTVAEYGKKMGLGAAKGMGSAAWRRLEGKDIKEGGGRISRFGAALRRRGEGPLAAIQEQIAKKDGRLNELLNTPEANLTEEEKTEQYALDTEIEALKTKEEEAKQEQRLDKRRWKPGHYAGGLIARWAGRAIELPSKEITMRMGDKDVRELEAGAREVEGRDSFSVFNMYRTEEAKGRLANKNRMAGLLNGIRNRQDGDDIEDAIKSGALTGNVVGQTIKAGLRGGPPQFRPLLKSFFAQVMLHPERYGFEALAIKNKTTGELEGFEGKDAEFLTHQLESIPTKFNAQDFQGDTIAPENFNMDTEEGRFFIQSIIKARGSDFLGQIARRPRKEESTNALQYMFKEGKFADTGLGDEWLLRNNAESVLRYLDSPGARSLGLGSGRDRHEIEEIIRQYQEKQRGGLQQLLPTEDQLNVEIVEHSVRIEDINQQITNKQTARTQSTSSADIIKIDQDINKFIEELNNLTQEVENRTDELSRLPKELQVLDEATASRWPIAGSTKTEDEVKQEVRAEYEQKYRASILNQTKQEGPFIQYIADSSGETLDQTEQKRIRQLYKASRLRDTTPPITPTPTAREQKMFENIARSAASMPAAGVRQRERKLSGSLQESLNFVQEIETQVNRLSQEIQEMNTRGEDVSLKETDRMSWYTQLGSAQKRMDEIARELGLTPLTL